MQVIRRGIVSKVLKCLTSIIGNGNQIKTINDFFKYFDNADQAIKTRIYNELRIEIIDDLFTNGLPTEIVEDRLKFMFQNDPYEIELRFFPYEIFDLLHEREFMSQNNKNAFIEANREIIALNLNTHEYRSLRLQGRLMETIDDLYTAYKIEYISKRSFVIFNILRKYEDLVSAGTELNSEVIANTLKWIYGYHYTSEIIRIKI